MKEEKYNIFIDVSKKKVDTSNVTPKSAAHCRLANGNDHDIIREPYPKQNWQRCKVCGYRETSMNSINEMYEYLKYITRPDYNE